jgi:acetoin utilization deacetylase AcuC-like enzyme
MQNTYLVADSFCLRHLTGAGHPESPFRYQAIDALMTHEGLKTEGNTLKPRKAQRDELLLCHSESYIKSVEEDIQRCIDLHLFDGSYILSTGDVHMCPESLHAALLAAGGALVGIEAVLEGRTDHLFSYLRPPGHHACSDKGMGFCIFNNIAIAARYAQKKYGIGHVLIVDWDVHHGNGTQEIFDRDPSVFYFSTHQEHLYPGTGAATDRGIGKAFGTKLNFPIAAGQRSRQAVLEAFQGPLMKSMEEFKPELVLISAGFDAHYSDPLGGFNLTENDFFELTKIVMEIADKYAGRRIVSLLEGGYDLAGLAASAVAHVKALSKSTP